MSYANGTTHYNLPQTTGSDKRDWSDTNQAFQDIDAALYQATQDTAQAAVDIAALETRMDTAEQNIATNTGDIAALDTRVTTVEGAVTSLSGQVTDTRQDLEDMICAYNEASATSTHAYVVGDYFIYNDVLYRAIQAIAIGDTIVPDTNCTTTNVTTEITAQKSKVVASVTAAAGQTIGGMLQALFSQFPTFDRTKEYLLVRVGSVVTTILHSSVVRVSSVDFYECSRASGTEFNTAFYELGATSTAYLFTVATSGNITSSNVTANSVAEGTIFRLLELTTA